MKLLIAGASGAMGSQLVPQLVAGGRATVGYDPLGRKTDALEEGMRP